MDQLGLQGGHQGAATTLERDQSAAAAMAAVREDLMPTFADPLPPPVSALADRPVTHQAAARLLLYHRRTPPWTGGWEFVRVPRAKYRTVSGADFDRSSGGIVCSRTWLILTAAVLGVQKAVVAVVSPAEQEQRHQYVRRG